MHTTNYTNTFIAIAEDCPLSFGEMPPLKGDKKSIPNYQFDKIYNHPYQYSSDEIIFDIFCIRNEIPKSEYEVEREKFFSKGQPCFRTSPLAKRYGWGIHFDNHSKVAIFSSDSAQYKTLLEDNTLKQVKAMKRKRQE